jgi:hypothetical protein
MHAVVHHAAFHPLSPGSPAYAIAKLSAVGGIIGLRIALSRRARRNAENAETAEEPPEHTSANPHPVSARKARRRSRKRR